MMTELTHFDEQGRARMVDVSEKGETVRMARAGGEIHMQPETMARIRAGKIRRKKRPLYSEEIMIKVLLFARLADLAKVRDTRFDCPEEGVRLDGLVKQVVARYPDLQTSLARPELLFLAINQEQAGLDAQVKDGDEVAIMPPFSGG